MKRIKRRKTSRQLVAPARKAEIAELAEAVADEHCPTGSVDPQAIARAKRITISFGPYGDAFDGMLEHKGGGPACRSPTKLQRSRGEGRFHIFCNLDRVGQPDAPRARFTLGHELGHYYIDEHRNALAAGRAAPHQSQAEYESPILAEQEADHFAANLLTPTARFLTKAQAAMPGLEGILSLTRTFKTSITATALRYAAADVSPCAVVKWNWKGYAWKYLSSTTFRASFRKTFESTDDLPEDSPTRRALSHQTPPECGYFQSGTTASAWFPRIKPGEFRDVIFIEQAIPLARYGVLTFLYPESGKCRFTDMTDAKKGKAC